MIGSQEPWNCLECDAANPSYEDECAACGTVRPGLEATSLSKPKELSPLRQANAAPAAVPVDEDVPPTAASVITKEAPEPTLLEGKWHLGKELGRGGMGRVYEGVDIALDRQVAIKMLSPSLASEAQIITRFEREAKLLAKLDHPNLVPIYAVGSHEGVPFLVMKRLEGMSLDGLIGDRGAMALPEAVKILAQACAGLAFMHERKIVHRDIKPANLFIGRDGHVHLLDLGIAQDVGQNLTRTGMMIGTPRYMSPEQIRGGVGGIDHRSDQYSLACVFYEMLTGKAVYSSDSEFETLEAHLKAPPPDVSIEVKGLPHALGAVVQRALGKKADDRYPSVSDFLLAVQNAVGAPTDKRRTLPREEVEQARAAATRSGSARRDPRRPPSKERRVPTAEEAPALGDQALQLTDAQQRAALRTPPSRLVALLALVLVPVAAGGWMFLRSGSSGGPEPLPLSDAEQQVAVKPAVDPKPPPELPVAEAVRKDPAPPEPKQEPPEVVAKQEPVKQEPPPDPKPTRNRRGNRREPKHTATQAEVQVAKAEPPAAGPGEVRVITRLGGESTWAWVEVDGVRQGSAPLSFKVPAGAHVVRVTREGFQAMDKKIQVAAGQRQVVEVNLTR